MACSSDAARSVMERGARRVLQGITGMRIGGGIASVARCVDSSLGELAAAGQLERVDRILLQDDPRHPPAAPAFGEQRLSRRSHLRFIAQLWWSLRRHHHDLVFFDQLGLARSILLPLPGFARTRYAIFCHGIELGRATQGRRRETLARAWRLLCNSERTAARVREQVPEAADRVRVVPLCIDPALTDTWGRTARGAGDVPRDPAVLIVGRMWSEEPGKGHDELIDAWPRIRRAIPSAELWIVGEGDDRERLERKSVEVAPEAGIQFFGRIDDAELGELYQRASLFAMPSAQEGFGLVYAEAMWHGLPCIGSTADSAGEVIRDGDTGVLVPYGDAGCIEQAIVALLGDPDRRRGMGEVGARVARERYSYPRFRGDLLRALDLASLGSE